MKKLIFSALLSLLTLASFSQTRFGITVGGNVSNLEYSGTLADNFESDYKSGLQAGLIIDLALTEQLSVMPEFLFSQKGYSDGFEIGSITTTNTFNLNYLTIPVNLGLKLSIGSDKYLVPFVGAYAGYALSGTWKTKVVNELLNSENVTDGELSIGDDDTDAFKPLDYGINVGIGFQTSHLLFRLHYDLGLANIEGEGMATFLQAWDADNAASTRNISLSVSYLF